MPDYSKGVIYTIRYKLDDSLLYVGSTTQPLWKRWSDHKSDCYNEKSKAYNMKLYHKMRDTNDINNWYIELYEKFPCNDKNELNKREGEIQRELKPCLNRYIAGRTIEEFKNELKEEIKINHKIWRDNNPDKVKATRERNIEKKIECDKNYRMNNTDKIKEYKSEKITCECGCIMRRDCLSQHKKTKKHIELLNKIE